MEVRQVKPSRKRAVVGADFFVGSFVKINEVHFVDGDDDVTNAQQRHDEAVPFGLSHHPMPRVNQDHGEIRGAGSRCHVASVLFVARSVRDDEFAFGGTEVTIGHVDRDALLAFFLQAVSCQCRVKLSANGSLRLGISFDLGQFVFIQHLRIEQQPADERAFSVVDAAARDESQQLLLLVLLQVRVDVGCDQV